MLSSKPKPKHYRFTREPFDAYVCMESHFSDGEVKKEYLDSTEAPLNETLELKGVTGDEEIVEQLADTIFNFNEVFYRSDQERIFVP